jgi:protoheme IX farnesyltransferase
MFKQYYSLVKPGVLYGNALTAVAGFLLASGDVHHFRLGLFVALLVGSSLVIGSACALNNYLDRDIDSVMERTKTRVVASGVIPGSHAVILSAALGIVGMVILFLYTNLLVVAIGAVGFVDYVVLYGMFSKRMSMHGTLVGSISGATPVLAGYCAVRGRIDAGAIIVFLILFLWQMPEFYSISIYRRKEYTAAGVPVISVVKGVRHTKVQILAYTVAFVAATLALTTFGYTGYTYLVVMSALGAYWIWLGMQGLRTSHDDRWARKMFRFSLVMILALSVMLSVGSVLP